MKIHPYAKERACKTDFVSVSEEPQFEFKIAQSYNEYQPNDPRFIYESIGYNETFEIEEALDRIFIKQGLGIQVADSITRGDYNKDETLVSGFVKGFMPMYYEVWLNTINLSWFCRDFDYMNYPECLHEIYRELNKVRGEIEKRKYGYLQVHDKQNREFWVKTPNIYYTGRN